MVPAHKKQKTGEAAAAGRGAGQCRAVCVGAAVCGRAAAAWLCWAGPVQCGRHVLPLPGSPSVVRRDSRVPATALAAAGEEGGEEQGDEEGEEEGGGPPPETPAEAGKGKQAGAATKSKQGTADTKGGEGRRCRCWPAWIEGAAGPARLYRWLPSAATAWCHAVPSYSPPCLAHAAEGAGGGAVERGRVYFFYRPKVGAASWRSCRRPALTAAAEPAAGSHVSSSASTVWTSCGTAVSRGTSSRCSSLQASPGSLHTRHARRWLWRRRRGWTICSASL